MISIMRQAVRGSFIPFVFLCIALPIISTSGFVSPALAANPLKILLGSWGGSGTFRLQDGSRERIRCNTYYTGGASQLRLAIRCRSDTKNIEIRSKLGYNAGNLSGSWEERTFNATGHASGNISGQKLKLRISGSSLSGSMTVSFNKKRQKISISISGVPLKSINITLRRR